MTTGGGRTLRREADKIYVSRFNGLNFAVHLGREKNVYDVYEPFSLTLPNGARVEGEGAVWGIMQRFHGQGGDILEYSTIHMEEAQREAHQLAIMSARGQSKGPTKYKGVVDCSGMPGKSSELVEVVPRSRLV